jgi:hypothetical protein
MKIRDRIKELRRVRASELMPNAKNWRRHPREQKTALRALLNEIGYADALIARELPDGRLELLDGHLRAETTPDELVPVLVLDVTEEEGDKILATLDPMALMAQTDEEQMQALLAKLQFESPALGPLLERMAGEQAWQAIGLPELTDPEVRLERAAELQAKWGTGAGQLWLIGPHRLLCGDSSEQADVGRLWANSGRKCRLVWTDPPYGVGYADKNKFLNRGDRGNRIQKEIANDHMSAEETERLFAAALAAVVPFCEAGAAIYATAPAGPLYTRFVAALEAAGFSFKHGLVWVKNQPAGRGRLCSNGRGEQETKEAPASRSGSALMALIWIDLDAGPLVVQVAGAVAQHVQMHRNREAGRRTGLPDDVSATGHKSRSRRHASRPVGSANRTA